MGWASLYHTAPPGVPLYFKGPATCLWYRILDARLAHHSNLLVSIGHVCIYGRSSDLLLGTLQRVALDQLLFAPFFLGVYFVYNGLWEGSSRAAIEHKLQKVPPSLRRRSPVASLVQSYFTALISNYKLWPAVQCINFYFVPLNYRLVFVNVVALGWCAYLSNLNYRHASRKPQ